MRECVLSVTVSNHPGVLARISNLFASLGINIDNIATVRSRDRHVSRVRIQAELDDEGVERISYSLQQLPDVIRLDKVRTRSKRFSYWSAAYGLFIAVMGLNLVSPIYAIYKQQWHLTPGMLSIAFAAYAIALIPTIIITGQLLSGGGFQPVSCARLDHRDGRHTLSAFCYELSDARDCQSSTGDIRRHIQRSYCCCSDPAASKAGSKAGRNGWCYRCDCRKCARANDGRHIGTICAVSGTAPLRRAFIAYDPRTPLSHKLPC